MISRTFILLLLSACNLTTGPGAEEPPVENCGHAWGDNDGDGVGYRLSTTKVRVLNTSGYPLDLDTLGLGVLTFSETEGDFDVPMERVNEPGNGWLGLAQVWVSNITGIVNRALVKMNEGYAAMQNPVTATHVGCMEVLHTVGLAHQNGNRIRDSCMNDCSESSNWGECMRDLAGQTPNPHDQEQLAIIYKTKPKPPTVCVQGEFTVLTFLFPAPGEGDDHEH